MSRIIRFNFLVLMFLTGVLQLAAQTPSWTLMNRGDRYFKQGDFKSAEKCYDDALELDTTNLKARYNLADTYLAQTVADSAYSHFQRVAKEGMDKDKLLSSKAFHNMGVILQSTANATQEPEKKQNYLKQAITDYKEALRQNPAADDSRYNMVLCMKQLKESQQNQQQDQQQDKNSDQKKEQQDKSKEDQQQQQPKPQDKQQPEKPQEQKANDQTKQILNYARQKEQQTKDKINVLPQKRHNGKNW